LPPQSIFQHLHLGTFDGVVQHPLDAGLQRPGPDLLLNGDAGGKVEVGVDAHRVSSESPAAAQHAERQQV
jgi:hypothetical protein